MTDLRTWEDELRDRGEPMASGAAYECPNCEQRRHAFAIVQTAAGDWHCSTCEVPPPEPGEPQLTWNDVRGVRSVFLQASDWTQLPDVPQATSDAWAPLRQRARDVGNEATPADAMEVLRSLQEQAAAL